MHPWLSWRGLPALALGTVIAAGATAAEQHEARPDYLSLAHGAIPVAIEPAGGALRVGMEQALRAIDGDAGGYVVTPKPGGAGTRVAFVYRLPAATTFTSFEIPNVLETPSPSQTFFGRVIVAGSAVSAKGPYEDLARGELARHARKGERTTMAAARETAVRWVRVTLEGGLDVQRDKTFFEFSEIVGRGRQEAVPRSTAFDGKWKGRGVALELRQAGPRVAGCYDGTGDLEGTVSGNILHATGRSRSGNIPSVFVLAVDDAGGIVGVRSTNGAPFKLYAGDPAPGADTRCGKPTVRPPGCGAVLHGIRFDFDSATLRAESADLIDALYQGLRAVPAGRITVIGHTSSEGSDAYNQGLSRRRAEAVAAALVSRGLDAKRLGAEGRGEKQPIADNATEAGRALNRRVEIGCG